MTLTPESWHRIRAARLAELRAIHPDLLTVAELVELALQEKQLKEATMEWQPIETAPKDGTAILCYDPEWDEYPIAMRWDGKHRFWEPCESLIAEASDELNPTHWMPLPPAPSNGPQQ